MRQNSVIEAGPYTSVRAYSRYSDRPVGWRVRFGGISGVGAVIALMLGAGLFSWRVAASIAGPSPPLVVQLLPLAAPPEPVAEVPEGVRQAEQKLQKPVEELPALPPPLLLQENALTPPVAPPVEQAKAAEPVAETTAPKTLPAPPARHASTDAERTWEALLLAHLERYRRYPAQARARREQGVAYVRFRMNRAGKVLSASLQRRSGSAALDKAALDTILRAQPLPAIPAERSDELELSVPVEFFVGKRSVGS